jgi:hypothetical protein
VSPFEGYTGGGGKEIIDGLLSTGDVGHFDEAGRLFIDGRDGEDVAAEQLQAFVKDTSPATRRRGRSCSSTSCRATRPARSSSASLRSQSAGGQHEPERRPARLRVEPRAVQTACRHRGGNLGLPVVGGDPRDHGWEVGARCEDRGAFDHLPAGRMRTGESGHQSDNRVVVHTTHRTAAAKSRSPSRPTAGSRQLIVACYRELHRCR